MAPVREDPPEPEPTLTVLVSSRAGHPVPVVAGAVRLEKLALAHRFTVRQTYALAQGADRLVASVVVRMGGPDPLRAAWAAWVRKGEGWRFDEAAVVAPEPRVIGVRQLTKWVAAW